jgi:hypothetical protein
MFAWKGNSDENIFLLGQNNVRMTRLPWLRGVIDNRNITFTVLPPNGISWSWSKEDLNNIFYTLEVERKIVSCSHQRFPQDALNITSPQA